jgi:hypothetical protein
MSVPSDPEFERAMIARMAEMISDVPKSMAWVFAQYKNTERADDAQIQRLLQISEEDYFHLAICGRPREYLFAEDIETLSERFHIPQEPLARLIRRVEALSDFREYSDVAASGMFDAARDIAEEPASPYDAEEAQPESNSGVDEDDEQ